MSLMCEFLEKSLYTSLKRKSNLRCGTNSSLIYLVEVFMIIYIFSLSICGGVENDPTIHKYDKLPESKKKKRKKKGSNGKDSK